MANNIQIDILATDRTAGAFSSVEENLMHLGGALTSIGNTLERAFTRPLQKAFRNLLKDEDIKKALEPVNTAFDEVFGELTESLVPVIEDITPALISLADSLGQVVAKFNELTPAQKEGILAMIALFAAVGPILTIVGPLLTGIGSIASALGGFGAIGTFISGTVLPALAGALAAIGGPVTLFIAAIGLLIANIALFVWNVKFYFNLYKGEIDGLIKKITSFKDAIIKSVPQWVDAGRRLIQGLVEGVKQTAGMLVSAVTGAVSNAIDAAKRLLGINSPSKVFMEIGKNMMAGWGEGVAKNNTVQQTVAGTINGMTTAPMGMGGGGINVYLQYAPVVSVMDKYEAETKLIPYIEAALRKIR